MLNKYYKFNSNTDQLIVNFTSTKNIIINILEYILAFCIILNANSIWNYVYLQKKITILTLVVLVILILIRAKDIVKNTKNLRILIILIMCLSIYNIIFILGNDINRIQFVEEFIVLFLGYIIYNVALVNEGNKGKLLIKISNIVVILAAISIICYILFSVINIIPAPSHLFYGWGGPREIPNYFNIYYVTQNMHLKGLLLIRNTGIFTEAPMYAFVLTIGILIELFVRKNLKKKNIAILIVTIFSTLSTTGIIVMLVVVFIKVLMEANKSKYKKLIKFIIIPILLIVSVFIAHYFLASKVKSGDASKTSSYSVRMDDFRVGFDAWKDNPIFGNGYNQFSHVQEYMNLELRGNDIGGSSGIMAVIPEGGILLFALYIIPMLLAIIYGIKKRKLGYIVVSLALFILLLVTKVPYRYIIIYFLAIGWNCLFDYKKNIKISGDENE